MRKSKNTEIGKQKHRKGLWSPEEDESSEIMSSIMAMPVGPRFRFSPVTRMTVIVPIGCSSIATSPNVEVEGLQRNGKSCRLRWINYLRPGLKRGPFRVQEEQKVIYLHAMLGNKWSQIAQQLAGRIDNERKNYWHSHLKEKLLKTSHAITGSNDDQNSNLSSSLMRSSSSYNSLTSIEKSPTDVDSVTKIGNRISNLRKIMFEEWLSLDSFSGFGVHQAMADFECSFRGNLMQSYDIDGLNEMFSSQLYNQFVDLN